MSFNLSTLRSNPGAPGRLISLHFEPSETITVSVERTTQGFAAHRDETVYIEELMVASGTIRDNFWKDASAMGLPGSIIANAIETPPVHHGFQQRHPNW